MKAIEILQACCAKEQTRYAIDKPFRRPGDASICATDGRILAWLFPPIAGFEVAVPNTPDVRAVMDSREKYAAEPTPIPPLPDKPLMVECPECKGNGSSDIHRVRCIDCGCTSVVCDECDDAGTVEVIRTVYLGTDLYIAESYAQLLVRFRARIYLSNDEKPKFYWEADTSDGLLVCGHLVGFIPEAVSHDLVIGRPDAPKEASK